MTFDGYRRFNFGEASERLAHATRNSKFEIMIAANNKPESNGDDESGTLDASLAFDAAISKDFAEHGEVRVVDATKDPWERLSTDTDRSFAAFVQYRDMGASRSLAKVRQKLGRKPGYVRQLEEWSKEHDWPRRVAAFDGEQDRLHLISLRDKRREMNERHAKSATLLQTLAIKALQKKFGADLSNIDAKEFSARDIMTIVEQAAKLERVALGEPSEIVETQLNGGNVSNDGEKRSVIVPLTFDGRIAEAAALLEVARARATSSATSTEN